jgi:DNA-binding transcriptional LysR family regulator
MRAVHESLAGIDLNLALVLDALLEERHVTRAAERLGITQSAASHALSRLRDVLRDPLLVRGPRGMVPTPRAEALAPVIRRSLGDLSAAFADDTRFDPATAKLTVRIATSDYIEFAILPTLVAQLAKLAPGIDVWVHAFNDRGDDLASGAVDLALAPKGTMRGAGVFEKTLFADNFRAVMREDHPLAGGRMTLARYCAADHVMVAPGGRPGSFVDDALARLGRSRRVAVAVPHFLVVPHLLVESDLIATLATRIADRVADRFGLVTMPPPIDIPDFTIAAAWHERTHHDPALRWLREQLFVI